jgi:hypothetical protein
MKNLSKLSPRAFTYLYLFIAFVLPVGLKTGLEFLPAVQRVEAMGSFSVNSTLDERDASLIDGICLSFPSGVCTLRAAIDQAGYNPGPDTIYLQENKTYKLTLVGLDDSNTVGDLDIYSDVTIEVGNGGQATIDGNGSVINDNVFHIFQGSVTMSGLVIRNGKKSGIYNYSTLVLRDVSVQDNFGTGCGTDVHGGIANHGYLKMYRTTVSGNTGYIGGGIFNVGTLLAVNSTVSGNSAFTSGGGIANDDYGLGGDLGQMTLLNTTVAFNKANICNLGGSGGGIVNSVLGGLKLTNTIVANNNRGLIFSVDDDCKGSFYSYGYNLIEVITGCYLENTTAGEIIGVDPVLGPLQNNGGLTATNALLLGSPAIDSGSMAGCKDELGNHISVDQRGVNRHLNGGSGVARCDMGAYEYGVLMPPPGGSFTSFIPFVRR